MKPQVPVKPEGKCLPEFIISNVSIEHHQFSMAKSTNGHINIYIYIYIHVCQKIHIIYSYVI